jgi:hypothetical protein
MGMLLSSLVIVVAINAQQFNTSTQIVCSPWGKDKIVQNGTQWEKAYGLVLAKGIVTKIRSGNKAIERNEEI